MKILYHHRIRSKDGQYVHVEELVKALRERGHEIVMAGPPATEQGAFGSESRLVAMLRRWLPGAAYEAMELAYSLVDYRRVARAVRLNDPDVIYERYNLFLPSGIWAKRRFGLPLILEVNAPLYSERSRYGGLALRRLARWSERYVWRGADAVLPVTRVLARHILEVGVPQSNVHVIPNGIDAERFSSAPDTYDAKRSLGLEAATVLGFVGFMREWHGLERIVDLIAEADADRHLLLVGDGPARDAIVEHARARGVAGRVTVTGVIGRDDVPRYIAAFDVALQPEVVDYASPLKLFEYMALGRAVVAPASPNITEVLTQGENALLFPPGDTGGMRAAIDRLCADPALRERLGAAARATVRERGYLWAENARRVEGLCRDLLGCEPQEVTT